MIQQPININYTVANNLTYAGNPVKGTIDSAGYDLFPAEEKMLEPATCTSISIELNMEIHEGYFGKIYPRSSLLKKNFISADGGVIDPGYCGVIKVLMRNYGKIPYFVSFAQIIAQIIFHKCEEVTFTKDEKLSKSVRKNGKFGSTRI